MTWQKAHHVKRVGIGSYVTLVELDVEIEDELIAKDMVGWSRRCSAAAGAVACLLDKRGLYQCVVENLIVYDAVGAVAGVADHTIGVRNFGVDRQPPRRFFDSTSGLTEELRVAARWFLQGVQKGPSEAGLLMLATATESLVNDTEKGKNSFSPNAIRQAFESAGGSEGDLRLGIGRCAGLRARVVHTGTEDDEELQRGWYSLEQIVRTILTNRLNISTSWPVDPSDGADEFADLDLRERQYEYGELQSG